MKIINALKAIFQLLFFQLLLFYIIGNSIVYSQTNFNIDIAHVVYEYFDPGMKVGLATVTWESSGVGKYYDTGTYDPHLTIFQKDPSVADPNNYFKIGNNIPLPVVGNSFSFWFNLSKGRTADYPHPGDPQDDHEFEVDILAFLTPYATDVWFWSELVFEDPNVPVDHTSDDINDGAILDGSDVSMAPISITKTHTVTDGRNFAYKENTPNLDLDRSQHPPTANFAGDWNACVPTATANSLKGLESEFDDFDLPDGSDLRDVMEELSGDMNRADEKGVNLFNQIRGTLDYAEKHNLPLEVKFQSRYRDIPIGSSTGDSWAANRNLKTDGDEIPHPTWDFLFQMMLDKEDVTINYLWENPDGGTGAHSVMLNDVSQYDSGVKKISFSHDGKQGVAGGTTSQAGGDIHIDDNGAMRFGPGNKYEIFLVTAKSPKVEEGEEEEGLLNEILGFFGFGKTQYSLLDNNDFIEVALHENIQNLDDYRISLYDGTDGTVYQTITLDLFTAGTTVNNRVYYFYNMAANTLLAGPAGLSISYTGTVLPGQFISYGGSFTAVEGDVTGMTSTNMGNFVQGESFVLTGTGSKYSDFSWSSMSNPSPGDVNPGQTYTLNTYQDISIPNNFIIRQNYPNPFNPSTTITFDLSEDANVKISIYDIMGRLIRVLVDQPMTVGSKMINWDGRDDVGNIVSGGAYFYNLKAGDYNQTKKMILLK